MPPFTPETPSVRRPLHGLSEEMQAKIIRTDLAAKGMKNTMTSKDEQQLHDEIGELGADEVYRPEV